HTSHATTALTTVAGNQDEDVSSYGEGGVGRDRAMERMEEQLRQLQDKVEGRPERRARGHPFSREILAAHLPNNFKETNLVYEGSSEPSRHVRTFENMVVLHGYSDSVCWRAFLSTLRGVALDWFHQLPSGSIADFEDFASKLTNQCSSAVVHEKTYLTLMAMRQGEKESLRKYVARYNQTCLETPARSYEEVLKRCMKYINLEEMEVEFAKLEGPARPEPKKEQSPPRGRSPRRSSPKRSGSKKISPRREARDSKREKRDDRWQGRPLLFERQRYHNFTPLKKDLTEVLKAMEQKMSNEDVTWPKTRFTGPTRPRSDIYCRFHRDYGHTMENCRHLKDEIERAKGKGRRRCRDDSEERSDRDEEGGDGDGQDGRGKKPRIDGDKGGHGGEALMKRGTIYMISGGPTDGDSNMARKEHARDVKRKREEVGITTRMPVISFKAEDAEGVVLAHNDALVITAEVAGFDVKRVFIDTGSSVDVMFYDCFVQINKDLNMELKSVTTALYGFNGGEVMPIGEISLPVALGAGELRKVRMVRFV
ncbi:Unknown protein, partial [Striga hermonthica]